MSSQFERQVDLLSVLLSKIANAAALICKQLTNIRETKSQWLHLPVATL